MQAFEQMLKSNDERSKFLKRATKEDFAEKLNVLEQQLQGERDKVKEVTLVCDQLMEEKVVLKDRCDRALQIAKEIKTTDTSTSLAVLQLLMILCEGNEGEHGCERRG